MSFKPGLLVWSFNRPAQLDLLLQSLDHFCPNQFDVNVIWKGEGDYEEGYIKCFGYHHRVWEHREFDFNAQTNYILGFYPYCAISTDDTVVFQPFRLVEEHLYGVDIFSLRLGLNTIIQEPFSGRIQPALNRYSDEVGTISWDSRYYHPHSNYGYQFGMDMVLYSKRYAELVKEIPFKKTNDIEGFLSTHARDKINPIIRSFKHSVAVNIPGNNLSGVTQADNSINFKETNDKFLEGKRFRLKEIEEMKVVGCHQLQDLVME